jgi:hypothetical protein
MNKTSEKAMASNLKQNLETVSIRVAVLYEEPLGWGSGKKYFPMILNNYNWKKQNRLYNIQTTKIKDKDILAGKLTKEHYDVLLVPGGGVGDGEAVIKGFSHLSNAKKWKKKIQKFIKDGGGYIGICGGAALATELKTESGKHETLMEKLYHKSAIGITNVKSYYKDLALPIFCLSQYRTPEKIGAMGYIFSFAPSELENGKKIHTGGVPIDFLINKNHAIFSDVSNTTVRIRWWGGPGLIPPSHSDRKIDVLASFPSTDISDSNNSSIYAWRYIGGLTGLIKGLYHSFRLIKKEKVSARNLFVYAFYLSRKWEKTNRKITMDLKERPSITAEIYPNKNEARIILCTSHPEYMIWWGGSIEEVKEESFTCIGTGLHQWKNIDKISSDFRKEFTYTWWIVRRFVAWAAKVPDEDLPPIEQGEMNDEAKKILSSNVMWDGSLIDQMNNI